MYIVHIFRNRLWRDRPPEPVIAHRDLDCGLLRITVPHLLTNGRRWNVCGT